MKSQQSHLSLIYGTCPTYHTCTGPYTDRSRVNVKQDKPSEPRKEPPFAQYSTVECTAERGHGQVRAYSGAYVYYEVRSSMELRCHSDNSITRYKFCLCLFVIRLLTLAPRVTRNIPERRNNPDGSLAIYIYIVCIFSCNTKSIVQCS